MSSSGSAPVKAPLAAASESVPVLGAGLAPGSAGSRSIDVEFNLLRTWTAARDDLHRRAVRHLVLLAGIVALGGVAVPLLASGAARARRGETVERGRLARETADLQALEARAGAYAAPLARRGALARSAADLDGLLAVVAAVVESCPGGLQIVRVTLDVADGLATAKIGARASDAATARSFLLALAGNARVREIRQTSIVGDGRGGVAFDVVVKGSVAGASSGPGGR